MAKILIYCLNSPVSPVLFNIVVAQEPTLLDEEAGGVLVEAPSERRRLAEDIGGVVVEGHFDVVA